MVASSDSDLANLRAEYSVIGSYVTAMTGMRFQTVAIYLAALGLIVGRGTPPWPTLLLIVVVSVGLWILDLRNREILRRLGDRGKDIEQRFWRYPEGSQTGFFLDREVRANLRIMTREIVPTSTWLPLRFISHAFAIDLVFLGVIAYAILVLALPGY